MQLQGLWFLAFFRVWFSILAEAKRGWLYQAPQVPPVQTWPIGQPLVQTEGQTPLPLDRQKTGSDHPGPDGDKVITLTKAELVAKALVRIGCRPTWRNCWDFPTLVMIIRSTAHPKRLRRVELLRQRSWKHNHGPLPMSPLLSQKRLCPRDASLDQ
jgi:hypothetical protein